jgi:peptidoglycan/xylan/chitin deacetylase (PgdA/CDA1 family)
LYYTVTPPAWLPKLCSNWYWRLPARQKELFLTFDDGPDPDITPWVLDQLKVHQAKATFFCIGKKAERYPQLLERIQQEGHAIGNHTYRHLSGWKTHLQTYLSDIKRCHNILDTHLFRPPYGHLTPLQRWKLPAHYKIIMWDVLGGDFDPNTSAQQVYQNIRENCRDGSIIVLHDTAKFADKLHFALPRLLKHFTEQGYQFGSLEFLNV